MDFGQFLYIRADALRDVSSIGLNKCLHDILLEIA